MDRVRVLRVIAANFPGLSLNESLLLADALHAEFSKPRTPKYDLATHEGLLAFAKAQPSVMECLPDRKIQAIKNLREKARALDVEAGNIDSMRYVGLKECKDVIDALCPYVPRF